MNQKSLLKQKNQRFKNYFKNLNIYLKFTIVFIIIMIIGLLPIEIKNNSFLFSGLFVDRDAGIDGLKQHLIFMRDYISHIKEGFNGGGISLYRFDIGLGADFINHYAYYSLFDPLILIAYIIPLKYIEFSYYLLIILRLFISGIAILLLAQKIGIKKDKSLLALSLFYTFNIAILFSAFRHPMFINGPIYLALIFYGYEKIKQGESVIPFILSVFFALISQFYIFIYLTFAFILFSFLDLLKNFKEKKFKFYLKINLYYLLGVLLGGFILTTQLLATLAGARVGSKGLELYGVLDYFVLIATNFLPIPGAHYTAGIGNLFVFIICLYFIFNEKAKSSYSKLFICLFGLSFFASFSYLLNAGSYVVNRWMFLITLPASILVGKYLDSRDELRPSSVLKVSRFFKLFCLIGILLLVIYLANWQLVTSLILGLVFFGLGFRVIYQKNRFESSESLISKILKSKNLSKYIIYYSLFSLLIMSGIYCFILTPNNSLEIYYGDSDKYSEIFNDEEFYRVEQATYVAGVRDFSNDGIYYGYPSTSSYNTMTNGHIIDLIAEYNLNNSNNSVGYNGFNGRPRMLTLNHVKYYIIRESEKRTPPYGFSYYDSVIVEKYAEDLKIYNRNGNILRDDEGEIIYERADIYVNNLLLNFGVVFDSYLSEEDVHELSSLDKEILLTKTIILAADSKEVPKYKDIDLLVRQTADFQWDEQSEISNSLLEENKSVLSFLIPKIEKQELYLEVLAIKNEDSNKSFKTKYSTYLFEEIVRNYGYATNMYLEHETHLVNLGYYNYEEDLEVIIELEAGTHFETIIYYLIDPVDLETDIQSLNSNSLIDLEFSNSGFKGTINTKEAGYMFISLPYSKGFSAFIDGEEVEIQQANTGYMAVYVEEGDKTLEFKYLTPGLEVGIYISVIAFVIFVLIVRSAILDKITVSNQTNKNEDKNEKNSKFLQ